MALNAFLIRVFVLVDDLYRQLARAPVRGRGPRHTAVTDPEVITIELVGESLDHDKGLFARIRRYHAADFPALARVHRTTFARQAANLYTMKKQLHAHLADRLAAWGHVFIADSLPVPARAFGRAKSCRRFAGAAAFEYDHARRNTMFGFRFHARATPTGAIVTFDLGRVDVPGRGSL